MAERRRNPLADEWVIVSPGRVQRPWQGDEADAPVVARRAWDPGCHPCPRNPRASGIVNPDYAGVFAFDNDFPALDAAPATEEDAGLLERETVTGRCRVLCYSHRHDRTLAELEDAELAAVVRAWREETDALGQDHAWVQVFENKGTMMGASSPHPHGQIWASSVVPTLPAREDVQQRAHAAAHGRPLLLDYAQQELASADRFVFGNGSWLAVVPFWAAWPFEIMLLPLVHCPGFADLHPRHATDLAEVMSTVMKGYDQLFGVPFPYSMGWHGRCRDQGDYWQLHAHIYPPLLRSATVRKFMVGYEMLAESQRDLTPEAAAARLRAAVS